MLVSLEWLSQYVDIEGIAAEEIAERLTRSGVEVEGIRKRDTGLQHVVVGKVLTAEQHPNADKLKVCRVDVGEDEPLEIVCGAPNVAAGQRVPVAKVGAVLPDLKIKKATLRGVESNGMILSASELGLSEKSSTGIMVLTETAAIGSDVKDVLGLDDTVLELDLTPNRADCLSMIGVAYEIAAIFNRELMLPDPQEMQVRRNLPAEIRLDAGEDCPLYALQVVQNIRLGPSPQWMQNRLTAAGIRPINNIVDITNYVMLEYGQPLHAFDYDRVDGGRVVVRYAREGETFETLDGVTRTLDDDMVLITDGNKPIGLAGVMGGANSEITEATRTVLLESAHFDAQSISKTSRQLGLRSEASARFEKKADPARVLPALRRAVQLMVDLADGDVASREVVEKTGEIPPTVVSMRYARMNRLLGTAIRPEEVRAIFDRLRLPYEDKGERIDVTVPTRRPDITIEADLIEEVARLYGYDNIPVTLPRGKNTAAALTAEQSLKRVMRRTLQGLGMTEVITYALTSADHHDEVASLNASARPIPLKLPMSEEHSVLRTGLLPGLIAAAEYNVHRREARIAIYEIGRTFITDEPVLSQLPDEEEEFAGLICGSLASPDWLNQAPALDFFTMKGLLEALFQRLGVTGITYEQSECRGFHPGRTAAIRLNESVIGYAGQLHPRITDKFDLPRDSYAFQMKLAPLLQAAGKQAVRYARLPRYPAVVRDLAVVVDTDVPAAVLAHTIRETAGELLESLSVFDMFTSEQIGKGKKSVAFSLTYRSSERTLTDAEVDALQDQIVSKLHEKHRAALRR